MGTRDEYVASIKSAFVTLGTKTVMAALIAEVPLFSSGFLNSLASKAIEWVMRKIVDGGETAAFFLYIDARVGKQSEEFEKAAYANHAAQLNGTEQEKKDAAEKLKKAFADFVRLTS